MMDIPKNSVLALMTFNGKLTYFQWKIWQLPMRKYATFLYFDVKTCRI